MPLQPESFGDPPRGLSTYHQNFLRKLKDSIEIMMGRQISQKQALGTLTAAEIVAKPRSQVVTIGDLVDILTELGLI